MKTFWRAKVNSSEIVGSRVVIGEAKGVLIQQTP